MDATLTTPAPLPDVGPPRWFSTAHVLLRHVGAVAAVLFFPLNGPLAALLVVSFVVRMWGMEAVFHRYFAHRSFDAGRGVQFALALIGIQCGQRGPLWWAYVHRLHHRYADLPEDRHSPIAHSFGHAYFGWMRTPEFCKVDWRVVADFAKYPELRWLTRYYEIPLEAVGLLLALAGHLGWFGPEVTGWSAFLWGYCVPLVLVLHAVALVNTICHLPRVPGGYQRYPREAYTVNRPLLSLFMLGAGYHNNNHRYASAARSGFAWYEPDACYRMLRVLQALGLIRNLRGTIPEEVRREGGLA
jgi:stearoyl-CoA desaturase (delta-9 desaturase)